MASYAEKHILGLEKGAHSRVKKIMID